MGLDSLIQTNQAGVTEWQSMQLYSLLAPFPSHKEAEAIKKNNKHILVQREEREGQHLGDDQHCQDQSQVLWLWTTWMS